MSWLLWRQHRAGAFVAIAVLAVFALAVWLTGVHMADVYQSAATSCTGRQTCLGSLFNGYGAIIDTVHLTIVVPVLFGAFLGATLVTRETDASTQILAWTQGVTRRRWVATKVAFTVVATVVVASLTSALVTWWSSTTNSLDGDRFQGAQFDTQNIVPVAHALFAVAIGMAAGAIFRRALPAIATTIGVYASVRLLVTLYARPHYAAADVASTPLGSPFDIGTYASNSWTLSTSILDPTGHLVNGPTEIPTGCAGLGRGPLEQCLGTLGYRKVVHFHPAASYWHFQWTESGLYVGAAVALTAVAVGLTLRRDA